MNLRPNEPKAIERSNNMFKTVYLSFNRLNNYEKYIAAFLLIVFIVIAVIRGNSVNYNSDFHAFWITGKNFYSGQQIYLTGRLLEFLYPPFAAVLFGLFSIFPLKVASILFSLINIVLWLACFYHSKLIIEQFLKIKINNLTLLLTLIFTINFYINNLNLRQVNLVVFYLMLLFIKSLLNKNDKYAGLYLAAAICFKITPIIFLAWLLIRGSFKSLIYTLVFIAAFVIIPLLMRGIDLGVEDLKLFFTTITDAASRASFNDFSKSRSLRSAMSNYLLSFESINEHYKYLIIEYTPVILGLTYISWLGILRLRKVPQKIYDISATFIVIFLISAETADAHMVSLAFPLMALLDIGFNSESRILKYLIFGVGLAFIIPIGEKLSYILLFRLSIYTLSMLLMYFLFIYLSFRPSFAKETPAYNLKQH